MRYLLLVVPATFFIASCWLASRVHVQVEEPDEPGWYAKADGLLHWWDGDAWTGEVSVSER